MRVSFLTPMKLRAAQRTHESRKPGAAGRPAGALLDDGFDFGCLKLREEFDPGVGGRQQQVARSRPDNIEGFARLEIHSPYDLQRTASCAGNPGQPGCPDTKDEHCERHHGHERRGQFHVLENLAAHRSDSGGNRIRCDQNRHGHTEGAFQERMRTPNLPPTSTSSPKPAILPFKAMRTGSDFAPSNSTMAPATIRFASANVISFSPMIACIRTGRPVRSGATATFAPDWFSPCILLRQPLSKYLSTVAWEMLPGRC